MNEKSKSLKKFNRKVNKKETFLVYILGKYYEIANQKLKEKKLKAIISKAVFINLVRKTNICNKTERALYKNLEFLENKKYLIYSNKILRLSKKGVLLYKKINKEILPYVKLIHVMSTIELYKIAKKSQTALENK